MPSIQIDLSDDDDDEFTAENAELSFIRITSNGVEIELRWEQAESLFNNLRGFFLDET